MELIHGLNEVQSARSVDFLEHALALVYAQVAFFHQNYATLKVTPAALVALGWWVFLMSLA